MSIRSGQPQAARTSDPADRGASPDALALSQSVARDVLRESFSLQLHGIDARSGVAGAIVTVAPLAVGVVVGETFAGLICGFAIGEIAWRVGRLHHGAAEMVASMTSAPVCTRPAAQDRHPPKAAVASPLSTFGVRRSASTGHGHPAMQAVEPTI